MIDSTHGTMSFSRQKRDEDGVPIPDDGPQPQRVVLTGPVPPYILKQMRATEPPKPLPANHPVNNPHAKTVGHRTMIELNGELRDSGALVEALARGLPEIPEVRSEALPALPEEGDRAVHSG